MGRKDARFDLKSCGMAIKMVRKQSGKSQEVFSSEIDIASSTLSRIENGKQAASMELVHKIMTSLAMSFDETFYPSETPDISSLRRQTFEDLKKLSDDDLIIIRETIKGIMLRNEKKETDNKT